MEKERKKEEKRDVMKEEDCGSGFSPSHPSQSHFHRLENLHFI